MQSGVGMTDLERAMADLAFIQQRLAASTRFDGLTPATVAATGVLALIAGALQAGWPGLGNTPAGFIGFWAMVALLAVALIGGEALARARRVHGSMANQLIAGTLRILLPFLFTGAGLAILLLRVAPDSAWMLPGLWQLLIALAGLSAIPMLPRTIALPAAWYFGCGFAVLAMAASRGAPEAWMMALPFGLGQLLVAWVLHRAAARGAA
jgi:hypothetical protein